MYVLPHPRCPSPPCPLGPLVTLSMQARTIPFMVHKANGSVVLCSILYICHFYFDVLCSFRLCMHELSQIETTIEMEITPMSWWLKGCNFLLFEAELSCLLFLGDSYGNVALFTTHQLYWRICTLWFNKGSINLSRGARIRTIRLGNGF